VILACRDEGRAQAAVTDIQRVRERERETVSTNIKNKSSIRDSYRVVLRLNLGTCLACKMLIFLKIN